MRLPSLLVLLATWALTQAACQPKPPAPIAQEPGDPQAPSLTATTPAHESTNVVPGTAITLEFSEPMKAGTGGVTVRAGDTPVVLSAPSWDATRRVLTLQPTAPLPPDTEVSVSVREDFTDDAGRPLAASTGFRFTTGSQGPRTALSRAEPAEGARDVYPVELHYDGAASRPGVYLRKRLTLTFGGPMDTSIAKVTLRPGDPQGEPRTLTGQWSSDQRTLSVTVAAPEEGGPPLEANTAYALDLSGLRDAAGNLLDGAPILGNGRLDFTTGARDGELEHACTHTLVNTPVEHTAAATPFAFPPSTDTGHTRYRLTLPGEPGAYAGYSEFISAPDVDEDITLYFARQVPLSVRNDTEGVDVPVEVRPTAPACAGITTQAHFGALAGDLIYLLHYGPAGFDSVEFIFERHAK